MCVHAGATYVLLLTSIIIIVNIIPINMKIIVYLHLACTCYMRHATEHVAKRKHIMPGGRKLQSSDDRAAPPHHTDVHVGRLAILHANPLQ